MNRRGFFGRLVAAAAAPVLVKLAKDLPEQPAESQVEPPVEPPTPEPVQSPTACITCGKECVKPPLQTVTWWDDSNDEQIYYDRQRYRAVSSTSWVVTTAASSTMGVWYVRETPNAPDTKDYVERDGKRICLACVFAGR